MVGTKRCSDMSEVPARRATSDIESDRVLSFLRSTSDLMSPTRSGWPAAEQVERGDVLRRVGLWVGVGVAFSLGGCQTFETALAPTEVRRASGTEVLASNELNRLGSQDLASGNFGLAERHFREAVESNAEDGPSWLGLAAAYDNLKRFELADRAYAQAVRIEGETLPILNNIAYSYYLRGDRSRALARFRRALELYPGQQVVLNNIRLVRSGEQPNRAAAP